MCHDKESVFHQSSGMLDGVSMDCGILFQTRYSGLLFPTHLNFRNSYSRIWDANSLSGERERRILVVKGVY